MKSRDRKNKLFRQYKRGLIPKENYIRYNSIYRKLIKSEQSKTFINQINSAGNNGKLKWKTIKEGLNLQKSNEAVVEINVNGRLITDENEIAVAFKHHFERGRACCCEGGQHCVLIHTR